MIEDPGKIVYLAFSVADGALSLEQLLLRQAGLGGRGEGRKRGVGWRGRIKNWQGKRKIHQKAATKILSC